MPHEWLQYLWWGSVVGAIGILYLILRHCHVRKIRRSFAGKSIDFTYTFPDSQGQTSTQVEARPEGVPRTLKTVSAPGNVRADDHKSERSKAPMLDANRLQIAVPAADAILASLPSVEALSNIDWSVFEAIRHSASRDSDLGRWSSLRKYISGLDLDPSKPRGAFSRLTGYVGEEKAKRTLEGAGHTVNYPTTSNQPGYDLIVDGEPLQIKTGDSAPQNIREHFDKYPDIPVATDTDAASLFVDTDLVEGLEGLEPDNLRSITTETLNAYEDIEVRSDDLHMPWFTLVSSMGREIDLLVEGHTDIKTSAKNAALDVAGTGGGAYVGMQTGAALGTVFGPAGTVIGGVLGGIGGAICGRGITNDMKRERLEDAANLYNDELQRARQYLAAKDMAAHKHTRALLNSQQNTLEADLAKLDRKVQERAEELHAEYQGLCVRAVEIFIRILADIEESWEIQKSEHASRLSRSLIVRKVIWPSEDDVERGTMCREFRQRRRDIRRSQKEFRRKLTAVPQQITAQQLIEDMREFVESNRCAGRRLAKLSSEIASLPAIYERRSSSLARAANGASKSIFDRSESVVRQKTIVYIKGKAPAISQELGKLKTAKQELEKEARKLGKSLDSPS